MENEKKKAKIIDLRQLLETGAHFGHQTNRWNPLMKKYIYGARNGIYIVDLQKTLKKFREAELYVQKIAQEGKKVLFVSTKRQAQELIAIQATRCGMYYINQCNLDFNNDTFINIVDVVALINLILN